MILLLTLLFGAALGWFFRRRPLRAPRRAITWLVAIAIGGPLLLLWGANILNSDALGWMAGLSMMVLLPSAPVLGLGGLLSWWLAGRSSGSGSEGGAQERNSHLGLILVMAGVGGAFWVFIAIGFWWHHQTPPATVSSGFPIAVLVFVAAIAFGAYLQCSICNSRLRVAHPSVSPGAPLFP